MAQKPGKRTSPTGAVQKHRACDECRSRKLACSKEPDGCLRCRREGIQCHYSPQKPMGRPRKRRQLDDEESIPRGASSSRDEPPQSQQRSTAATPSFTDYGASPMMPLDPNLGFLDDSVHPGGHHHNHHNPHGGHMDFLDLLPVSYPEASHVDPQILLAHEVSADGVDFPLGLGSADFFSSVPFEEPGIPYGTPSKDMTDSLHQYMMSQYTHPLEPAESTPSVQSNSAGSPEPIHSMPPVATTVQRQQHQHSATTAGGAPLKPNPNISCGCLSSLYLTLDSLSRLPSDINAAMRVARNASKVAHDVINCPYCFSITLEDVTAPVPLQGFQSLMCLAALVPSACNAYAGILEMVDQQAQLAVDEGRNLWFSFKDIGGVWGRIGEELGHFYALQSYNNTHMTPDFWRTTIRAILRLDIYGITEMKHPPPPEECRQQGLRDVVVALEEHSRKRHDAMDDLIANGKMPSDPGYLLYPGHMKPGPPEERNCYRMLETARMALENLVIA